MNGLYSELKRRNVFRVAIAYVLVAWVVLQTADVLFPALSLPAWTVRLVAGLLILGFPCALLFAWAYELTPEGLKREHEVDPSQSITQSTGRKLDFVVIAVLTVALGIFALDRFAWQQKPAATESAQGDRSIAVLPFVNMSDDPANEYFSDGISEELLTLLSQIRELKVIGRTSSFQFKGRNEDLREIGKALGASNLLEGSVRKSGNQVRITAQLISAADGVHIWSGSYDRDLDDIFKVQEQIAKAVVDALRVELLGDPIPERGRLTSAAAYDTYLKGLFAYRKFSVDDIAAAIAYFEEAIKLDPALAVAWEKMGSAQMNQTLAGTLPLAEGLRKVRSSLERAILLDADLADAHYQLGFLQMAFEWSWDAAQASMQKALAIDPNNSGTLSGLALLHLALGHFEQAEVLMQESIRADPLRVASRHNLGFVYFNSGQAQAAVEAFRDALEYSPNLVRAHFRHALALLANGEAEAALVEARREGGEQWRLAGIAIIGHSLQDKEEADAALTQLADRYAADAPYIIAVAYAVRADPDKAFEWFDTAYKLHDPLMPWIRSDPFLEAVRDDARFTALLDRLGLPR